MRNPFKGVFKRGVADPYHWITRLITSGSSAGVNVTPDNALKSAAVYACNKVLAETLASLPLHLYKRVGQGKEMATDNPLYSLMHDAPNEYQTSFEFRECIITHLNLRGNAYCYKIENDRGIEQLILLNPASMAVSRVNGNLVYTYMHEDGRSEDFPSEKIWHLKLMPISCVYNGASPEGIMGVSPIQAARETIGIALAADEYGARYFSNNATMGINFQYPGKLSENARAFLKESLAEYAKLENKFKSIITEEGAKLENLGKSNEESQFLQSRQFEVEEIARIFRVPAVLIGHPTNTMTYASAEQLFLAFANYTIQPWCERLEQSMSMSLIAPDDRRKYFFEHDMKALLRGDTKTRYEVYGIARQWGIANVDEIRALENMNPLENGKGQIYLQPMNMIEAGTEPPPPKEPGFPKKGNGQDIEEEGNAIAET